MAKQNDKGRLAGRLPSVDELKELWSSIGVDDGQALIAANQIRNSISWYIILYELSERIKSDDTEERLHIEATRAFRLLRRKVRRPNEYVAALNRVGDLVHQFCADPIAVGLSFMSKTGLQLIQLEHEDWDDPDAKERKIWELEDRCEELAKEDILPDEERPEAAQLDPRNYIGPEIQEDILIYLRGCTWPKKHKHEPVGASYKYADSYLATSLARIFQSITGASACRSNARFMELCEEVKRVGNLQSFSAEYQIKKFEAQKAEKEESWARLEAEEELPM